MVMDMILTVFHIRSSGPRVHKRLGIGAKVGDAMETDSNAADAKPMSNADFKNFFKKAT